MKRAFLLLFSLQFFLYSFAQQERLQFLLDSLCRAGGFPGLSLSVIKDNKAISLVSGYSDKEKKIPLQTSDRLLQGSVGKTYVSAIAITYIKDGKLHPDEKVSHYLGQYAWFSRLPNAKDITVRMLMNHTSGIMRYEFKPQFTADLTTQPDKVWKPEDLLQYVLNEKASFAAGQGWEYSDTNYILLGMILEAISGKKYYTLLQEKLLQPHQLNATFPSDRRLLPGLAQGYAGANNEFGGKDKVVHDDGRFIINPQFEWTGGGVYSTTADLARWGKLLYEGKITDTALMLQGAVPARLGRDTKYGLGVIIRQTEGLGTSYGHSGFFPGYMTELAYYPARQLSIALQCNSSDTKNLKISLQRCLAVLAGAAAAP